MLWSTDLVGSFQPSAVDVLTSKLSHLGIDPSKCRRNALGNSINSCVPFFIPRNNCVLLLFQIKTVKGSVKDKRAHPKATKGRRTKETTKKREKAGTKKDNKKKSCNDKPDEEGSIKPIVVDSCSDENEASSSSSESSGSLATGESEMMSEPEDGELCSTEDSDSDVEMLDAEDLDLPPTVYKSDFQKSEPVPPPDPDDGLTYYLLFFLTQYVFQTTKSNIGYKCNYDLIHENK